MGIIDEYFEPALCGGIFFALIKESTNPLLSRREYVKSKKEHYSNPNILRSLFTVVCEESASIPAGRSWSSITNKFKSCQKGKSDYITIEKQENIDAFNKCVKGNYYEALAKMIDFVDEFIDITGESEKHKMLVKRLLYVIEKDSSIDISQPFVFSNGRTVSKTELLLRDELNIHEFLLGVLHFIVNERRDNTVGQDTYNKWWQFDKSARNAEREYSGPDELILRRNVEVNCEMPESEGGAGNQSNHFASPRFQPSPIQNAASDKVLREWADVKAIQPFAGHVDYSSPDKIMLVSGLMPHTRKTPQFMKTTTAAVGDILDVKMYMRNLSGQTLFFVVAASFSRGLQYVKGSTVLHNHLNRTGVSINDLTRYTNIGKVEWYNPATDLGPELGWAEIAYQVQVVADEQLAAHGLCTLHMSSIVSGHDKDNHALTSSYSYALSVTVDFSGSVAVAE